MACPYTAKDKIAGKKTALQTQQKRPPEGKAAAANPRKNLISGEARYMRFAKYNRHPPRRAGSAANPSELW